MSAPAGWSIREFDAVRDADLVNRIDTSNVSDATYVVVQEDGGIALRSRKADAPVMKAYPIDLVADRWTHGMVATLDGEVRAFIAWSLEAWNRRMTIWHFYVDRPCRRQGAGRMLMEAALDWARTHGAATLWLETSSLNQAGIDSYRHLGFELCGFDASLYHGTPEKDEVAVYMARPT